MVYCLKFGQCIHWDQMNMQNNFGGHMTNTALIMALKMRFKECATLTSAATPPKFFCGNYLTIPMLRLVDTEDHHLPL